MPIGQSKAMWCNLVHLQVSPDLEPMQVAPPDDQILNKYNDQENWIFRKWLKILQPLPEPNALSFLPDDGLSSHPAFLLGPTCLGSSQGIALRMRPNLICRLWIWQCRGRLQQRLPYPARLTALSPALVSAGASPFNHFDYVALPGIMMMMTALHHLVEFSNVANFLSIFKRTF